ncbi:MAG: hypothetical protein K0R62_1575, partial [Nonomuraea muscovyensis]|nr:hypothetical protein [Nonomuraea muscovyensis]
MQIVTAQQFRSNRDDPPYPL